jgi:hypothetical protein
MSRPEQQVRDEIALREASVADARRERDAGELSADEAAAIERREQAALARLRDELASLSATPATPRVPRRHRRWLLVSALACFVVAAGVLLWSSLAPRQPGTSITGSVSLGRAQQVTQLLDEAQVDVANGHVTAALNAYGQVLVLSPKDVTAMTQTGWLEFSAGSSRHRASLVALGVEELHAAVSEHPRAAAPRLYYAIVADATPHNEALAKTQFRIFLDLGPSAAQLAVARPFLVALGLPTS